MFKISKLLSLGSNTIMNKILKQPVYKNYEIV
jgi:hypothetical protein